MQQKTRVVVCGEKWVAQQCLQFLYDRQDTELCAIVTAATDWQADLPSWGAKKKVKVYVGNINHYVNELTALQPDFLFSIQYRPLLRPPILRLPKNGCANLHFSMLPRYGGCYPIAWAILNGEQQTGATLHYTTERFDDGDLIAQVAVPMGPTMTAREAFDAVSVAAVKLFTDIYARLCHGAIATRPQTVSEQLYFAKDSIDFERDRYIDWRKPGVDIQRQIRAFSFEPFQLPATILQLPDGRRENVTVAQVRLSNGLRQSSAGRVGQVIDATAAGAVRVVTGGGSMLEIGLLNHQPSRDLIASFGYRPTDVKLT
ncbi:MAG: formyltransferase family protein [Candidatus Tectomicrobia bacterium]|nr:formyltransferase family protein [Candidatus Tectomicrobia bacterium]